MGRLISALLGGDSLTNCNTVYIERDKNAKNDKCVKCVKCGKCVKTLNLAHG
jgi:TPP-dependent indolepyruvate ferredoxin oxidoreductase alpha subunit